MKMANKKRFTVVIFLMLIMFSCVNPIFAAINESYQPTQGVMDDDIDTKVKDSVVIDALATFAYSIGSIVENLVGKAFTGLTGSNIFPWADRILFNAIPMLDVNIFNPAPSSLFKTKAGDVTPLAKIVRNTYFTILTLSVAFLTIVVGIAAVRLAISSIASEKAKYKEAITKWMFSIVLIFLMHNAISFILWMNEQMVVVASTLLNESLLDANVALLNESLTIDNEKAFENFWKANETGWVNGIDDATLQSYKTLLENNKEVLYYFMNSEKYHQSVLFDSYSDSSHSFRNWVQQFSNANGVQSIIALRNDVAFIVNTEEWFTYGATLVKIEDFVDALNLNDDELDGNAAYGLYCNNVDSMWSDSEDKKKAAFRNYASVMINAYNSFSPKGSIGVSTSNDTPDLMASLGQYFKEAAYTVPTDDETGQMTGWRRSKLTITGALLYAIFVFQSIFYFFAYIKRFFYIVILIIMAPVIVIIDFLRKAIV